MVKLGSYTFGVVAFGWVLLSTEATAQVGGTVQDRSGFPIPLANLELWSGSGVLESPLSDRSSRFSFPPVPSARGVRVSALGMRTIRGPLGDLLSALVVILNSQPLNLPQIEISATPFSCPEKDDPEARRLWGKVLESSPIPPAGSYLGAGIIQMKERVTWKGDFCELEQMTPEWAKVQGKTAQVFGRQWDPDSLVRVGCGRRREVISHDGREVAWDFPEVDGGFFSLFGAPHFLSLQKVRFGAADSTGTTLVLCDERGDGVDVSGQINLDGSGEPNRADWRFATEIPSEEAGGQAVFGAGSDSLLPSSGLFGRRTQAGKYYQVAYWYSDWFLGDREGLSRFLRMRREARGSGSAGASLSRPPN